MNRRARVAMMGALANTLSLGVAGADVIRVEPGEGALALAAAKANSGDVLALAAGHYDGRATLGRGVSVRGAGADQTRIVLREADFAFECLEGENAISALEIAGRDQQRHVGVRIGGPARIERVRFVNLNAGVRIEAAPLTDVVACEFDTCNLGIWSEEGASPTVWACRFEKCAVGVFNVEGAPLVRNCFFYNSLTGVQLFAGSKGRLATLRNNLFWRCGRHAIELHTQTDPAEAPSIRNNMFYECSALLQCDEPMADRFSHMFISSVREPLLRDRKRAEVNFDQEERLVTSGEARLSLSDDGSIEVGAIELMRRGAALGSEPEGTRHWLGLEPLWMNPGVKAPVASAPAARFGGADGEPIVTNGEIEERQVLEEMGFDAAMLERSVDNVKDLVEYSGVDDGGVVLRFDARRYLGEAELEPQGPPWWSVRAGGDGRKPAEGGD